MCTFASYKIIYIHCFRTLKQSQTNTINFILANPLDAPSWCERYIQVEHNHYNNFTKDDLRVDQVWKLWQGLLEGSSYFTRGAGHTLNQDWVQPSHVLPNGTIDCRGSREGGGEWKKVRWKMGKLSTEYIQYHRSNVYTGEAIIVTHKSNPLGVCYHQQMIANCSILAATAAQDTITLITPQNRHNTR